MNERIRELAEQAGVDAGQTIANTICGVCGDDEWVALGNEFNKLSQKTRDLIYKTLEQNQEKFAELIVKECVDVLNKRFMGDLNREDMEVRQCIADVKKHFGVSND
jgi:hypothetical protein